MPELSAANLASSSGEEAAQYAAARLSEAFALYIFQAWTPMTIANAAVMVKTMKLRFLFQ